LGGLPGKTGFCDTLSLGFPEIDGQNGQISRNSRIPEETCPMKHALLSGLIALVLSGPALASEDAARLAGLPKAEFLTAYEENFMNMLETSNALVTRMDPALAGFADVETPLSDGERASFECTYDTFAEAGELEILSTQMTMMAKIREIMQTDPEFNYANFVLDERLMEEIAPPNTETMAKAMRDCDMVSVSSGRLAMTPEFWGKLQEAGRAKGLVAD